MDKLTTYQLLDNLGACRPALDWAVDHPDPEEAYNACPNLEWLFWLLVECGIKRDRLLSAELALAHLAADILPMQTAARYVYDHLLLLAENPPAMRLSPASVRALRMVAYREYINARRGSLQEAAWAIARDIINMAEDKSWTSLLPIYNGSAPSQSEPIPRAWLDTVRECIPFSVVFGAYNDHK